ncbi:hypothetical protein CPT_Stills68 [Bacillus phage Stills]|uniref:Uncharacterized protein n=1 Tax=Bacillus phage Stills TaxID=1610833 RepID=A0A0E3T5L2_9CAUD|nr:hypothetical protein CPT_Stills68 [Bacillus phage Stills]AKC02696.1 hypothetical protein CPT_Stills68 [Bacillus phage Stills]
MRMINMKTIIDTIKEETKTFIAVNGHKPDTVALGAIQRQAIKEYLKTCTFTSDKMLESNVICGLKIVEAITPDQVSVYKELW